MTGKIRVVREITKFKISLCHPVQHVPNPLRCPTLGSCQYQKLPSSQLLLKVRANLVPLSCYILLQRPHSPDSKSVCPLRLMTRTK